MPYSNAMHDLRLVPTKKKKIQLWKTFGGNYRNLNIDDMLDDVIELLLLVFLGLKILFM